MKRHLLILLFFILHTYAFAQVQVRDTTLVWQHYDYTLDEHYSIASFSTTEIVEREFKGIVLENELVKITVVPEFGARVVSFIYKPTGHEQLYTNELGVPYLIGDNIFYHDWLMQYAGVFPTFPEPEHGKYWCVPWNQKAPEVLSDGVRLSMWIQDNLDNPQHPPQYNNGVTNVTCYFDVILREGASNFEVNVRLENLAVDNNLEYWTCVTFAPGSTVENPRTSFNSEMIVPIDQYEVGWSPGNWLTSIDKLVSNGPRVQEYTNLPLLKNWEEQGIAYAYPSFKKDFYGVINHDNEEGLFRISNDQSLTPGLKFWAWGEPGENVDVSDFYAYERPNVELWSGLSHQFFKDYKMAAYERLEWTETYMPSVGLSHVDYIDKHFALDLEQPSLNRINFSTFQPLEKEYQVQLLVMDEEKEVYQKIYTIQSSTVQSFKEEIIFSELNIPVDKYKASLSVIKEDKVLHSETFNVTVGDERDPSEEDVISSLEKELVVQFKNQNTGQIDIVFSDHSQRLIQLYDLEGRVVFQQNTNQTEVKITALTKGIYIVNIQDNNQNKLTKKVGVL
ncbi:DUF5107 domain-containing protein [Flammeovirga sp. SJP92]|uniref:DUF5107 domain-containing protein n=1 Tax=Flammeovirga sp. SJP92 TaxID=1775430 RepID=UPI0015619721|nr:DUF5107 domain-containing protein [Flammeovirga sp. SJP92]